MTALICRTAALGSAAKAWACTRDNFTGLLWEVKVADGGLRDTYSTYTRYNPNSATNGGFAGYQDGGNCMGGIACDSYSYVKAVNTIKLCGKSDWRMPTVDEFFNLTDLTRYAPALNPAYFPNIHPYFYLTASVSPGFYGHNAWIIHTSGAVSNDAGEGAPYASRVMLVEGK